MKYRIKLIFCSMGLFIASSLLSQSVNQSKMEKDLRIAEDVLSSYLSKNSNNRFLWRNNNVQGEYLEGYGVRLKVNDRFSGLVIADVQDSEDGVIVEEGSNAPVVIGRASNFPNQSVYSVSKGDNAVPTKEIFSDFLKDYHSVIRQLKPTDKIGIKTYSNNRMQNELRWAIATTQSRSLNKKSVSVEALVKDLRDFEDGKLTEEQMDDKITVLYSSSVAEDEPELEVFSAAFGRRYQSDLSTTYYMTGYPYFERTKGFGITYYLKFYSSTESNGKYFLNTLKKDDLSLEQRNKVVNDAYPDWNKDVKENMLDYGHLLSNLKPEENLVFHIELTECKGCEMPAVIELSVKKSVIDDYRAGGLSIDQALSKIQEKILKD